MAVRCKPEMFTVFECRCPLGDLHSKKDLLKIDTVARTLMKVMNTPEQTIEKGHFIGQFCFLIRYTKTCLITIEDKKSTRYL